MPVVKVFMYHDIRDHERTDFGRRYYKRYNLRSFLDKTQFEHQINLIKNSSDIISCSDFLQLDKKDNGSYSILSFDDGLLDHYHIQNILIENKASGVFLIPAEPVIERKIMRTHKIQFIMASADEKKIVLWICDKLGDKGELWNKFSKSKWKNNWWSPEMVFITNILRKHPQGQSMTDELFNMFVTSDEASFCDEFYLNNNQIREMVTNGMEMGGHGYVSNNLSRMTAAEVYDELSKSVKFVKNFYDGYRLFAYPNGGYNDIVLSCMVEHKYDLSFTTQQDTLLSLENLTPLKIPRYDGPQALPLC